MLKALQSPGNDDIFRLPETAGLALPETYEEAVDLGAAAAAKRYSLLKSDSDSDDDYRAASADEDSQFSNLDFANYELRYSAYEK